MLKQKHVEDEEEEINQQTNINEIDDFETQSHQIVKKQQQDHEQQLQQQSKQQKPTHARWANAKSDLLAILKVVGALDYEKDKEQFCKTNRLHYKV